MENKISIVNKKVNDYLKKEEYDNALELLFISLEEGLENKEYMLYTSSLILLLNTYNLMNLEMKIADVIEELNSFLELDCLENNIDNATIFFDTGSNLYQIGFVSISLLYYKKAISSYKNSLEKNTLLLKDMLEEIVPILYAKEQYLEVVNLNEMFINEVGEESYEYHFEVLAASNEILKSLFSIDLPFRENSLLEKYLKLSYRIIMSIKIDDTDIYLIAKNISGYLEYLDMNKLADNINKKTVEYYNMLLEEAKAEF